MTLGEKIQQFRKANRFSQEQLAQQLGVSRQA
ncbi:helix-turn-helix transcriptional regulator [Paenibacillus thiaminolyticus]